MAYGSWIQVPGCTITVAVRYILGFKGAICPPRSSTSKSQRGNSMSTLGLLGTTCLPAVCRRIDSPRTVQQTWGLQNRSASHSTSTVLLSGSWSHLPIHKAPKLFALPFRAQSIWSENVGPVALDRVDVVAKRYRDRLLLIHLGTVWSSYIGKKT